MSEDETNDPKIVSLVERFKKAEEVRTPVVEHRSAYDVDGCGHKQSIIDDKLPKLTCAKCGEILDPYTVLRELAAHYRERDQRWHEIHEDEKRLRQDAAAHLWSPTSRMRRRKVAKGEPPNYATRDGAYVARKNGEAWEVLWSGTIVRKAPTLAACRTFVRQHVRANWGKEEARSLAQKEASTRHATAITPEAL